MNDFSFLTEKGVAVVISGAAGGLVKWITLREKLMDGVASILVGGICAYYLSPLALPAIEPILGRLIIENDAKVGLSGFLIGVGGIAVSGFIIDIWRGWRRRSLFRTPPAWQKEYKDENRNDDK